MILKAIMLALLLQVGGEQPDTEYGGLLSSAIEKRITEVADRLEAQGQARQGLLERILARQDEQRKAQNEQMESLRKLIERLRPDVPIDADNIEGLGLLERLAEIRQEATAARENIGRWRDEDSQRWTPVKNIIERVDGMLGALAWMLVKLLIGVGILGAMVLAMWLAVAIMYKRLMGKLLLLPTGKSDE